MIAHFVMNSPYSNYPSCWKRPNEVMIKEIKKRKRALDKRIKKDNSQITSKHKTEKKAKICRSERYNPFKIASINEKNKPNLEQDESSDSILFQLFNPEYKSASQSSSQSTPTILEIPNFLFGPDETKKIIKDDTIWLTKIPLDWSLKTNLRIISSVNFKWNSSTLKTTEEASGTTGFVRCLNSDDNFRLDTTPSAELHQRCLIWIHPSLPWLNLFPRLTTKASAVNTFCSSNNEIKEKLQLDWCDSFRSLWQLLRSRQCAYFYFCAHTFTILFRASGIAGKSEINAMISPTTSGFRSALTEEGINFTQPLSKSHRNSSTDSGIGTDSETSQEIRTSISQIDEFDITNSEGEEEDVSSWMSSIGLEEKSVLTGLVLQRKFGQRKKKMADTRPESLVYVEGMDVHALYNFLLNSNNICIANTGSLNGIPPTLISSVAFQGATLRPLKVKHEMVQQGKEKFHSLELSGPILPHIPHSLIKLMKRDNSDIESYKILMSTLDTTTTFSKMTNLPTFSQSEFAKQNLTDCGFHEDLINILCSSENSQVINDITVERGVFKCR